MGKGLGLNTNYILIISQRHFISINYPMSQNKIIVFLDVEKGKLKMGRIKIELWNDKLPKTC